MTFLSGWGRRKSKVVSGSTAGAQTNFQMQLTVYKSAGVDTNTEVYLGTNVRDDFGDVRFTDTDGTSLLDYWIESYTSGVSAVIWIEIDSIPASPSSTTIYIYYDNASVTTTSNGANTFGFFDHFEGTTYDTSKWTTEVVGPNGGYITVSGSVIQITAGYGTWRLFKASNAPTSSLPFTIEYLAKVAVESGTNLSIGTNNFGSTWGTTSEIFGYRAGPLGNEPKEWRVRNNVGQVGYERTTSLLNWKKLRIDAKTDSIDFYEAGELVKHATDYLPNVAMGAFLGAANSEIVYVDYVFIRKYASPEPTFGATGTASVVNVSSTTADGTYTTGQTIAVTVTFEESVIVVGTPQLQLETGATDRQATYSSGSGSNILTFNYLIQSGDASSHLDYVSNNSLTLNGGTIKDTNNNDADLTLAVPGAAGSLGANKNIVISTVTPANITATDMTITQSETPCRVGICTVTVDVIWTNTGGSAGTFTPSMTIDGTPVAVTPPLNPVTVDPTETASQQFIVSSLTVGTHVMCPVPN